MARRGQGGRLPIPTEAEFHKQMLDEREVVACSGARFGPQSALSIACHNGDIATLVLGEYAAGCLVAVIKSLFPECGSIRAAVEWDGGDSAKAQAGHMSSQY